MAIFTAPDGRELDEKDVVKALKYYEFLYKAKHPEHRSDRSRPKPAAKLRKALAGRPAGYVHPTVFRSTDGKSELTLKIHS